MKTSLGLCLAMMVFLASDWAIQGTEGIKCKVGAKCNGIHGCEDKEMTSVDCSEFSKEIKKCVTWIFTGKDGKKGSSHGCSLGLCEKLKETNAAMAESNRPAELSCEFCEKDECNAAPKSAQRLGLFMMTAAFATVVILGM